MLLTATIASVFDVAIVVKIDATYLCVRGTHILQSTMYSKYWVFDQICFCDLDFERNLCLDENLVCYSEYYNTPPTTEKSVNGQNIPWVVHGKFLCNTTTS
jgi:hypothetical protein